MCVPTYLNPGFNFPSFIWSGVTPFKTSKATRTLSKYFSFAFVQQVVPVFWSILYASSTVLVTWIPKLCVVLHYFALTFEIIWSCLQITSFTHHLKTGSYPTFFATAYSASSTWFEGLITLKSIQIKVTFFHSTYIFKHLVDFLTCRFLPQILTNPLLLFNALTSAWCLLVSFITW